MGCGKDPASSTPERRKGSESSHPLQENHAIYSNARRIVSEEFGLVNMRIEIFASEVQNQAVGFDNKIIFEDALRAALQSFMEDSSDLESPLGLIKDNFFSGSKEGSKAILFEYLNRSSTFLKLIMFDTKEGYPEHGESIQENWLFQLKISSFSDHLYWAIVDRSGKLPPYNYGFN